MYVILDVVQQTTRDLHMKTMKTTQKSKYYKVLVYTLEKVNVHNTYVNEYSSTSSTVHSGCYSKKEYTATVRELKEVVLNNWKSKDYVYTFATSLNECLAGGRSDLPKYIWIVPDGLSIQLRDRKETNSHSRKRKRKYYCDCRYCQSRAKSKKSAGAATFKLQNKHPEYKLDSH